MSTTRNIPNMVLIITFVHINEQEYDSLDINMTKREIIQNRTELMNI